MNVADLSVKRVLAQHGVTLPAGNWLSCEWSELLEHRNALNRAVTASPTARSASSAT